MVVKGVERYLVVKGTLIIEIRMGISEEKKGKETSSSEFIPQTPIYKHMKLVIGGHFLTILPFSSAIYLLRIIMTQYNEIRHEMRLLCTAKSYS